MSTETASPEALHTTREFVGHRQMGMKILWVKAEKLLPVDTGGRIRSYNILRQLARRHQVVLFSYYSGSPDAAYDKEIAAQFPGAISVCTNAPGKGSIAEAFKYLSTIFSTVPYSVVKFTDQGVKNQVKQLLTGFDIAVCDFLSASLNFPTSLPVPTVLFQHNVESAMWQRQAKGQNNLVKRAAFQWEAAKLTRYEPRAVRRFDRVIAVSESDRELMKSMTDSERISVVPTGVDTRDFSAQAHVESRDPLVVFAGQMNYEPNIDAVEYFCRDIWPAVLTNVPKARFRIVGKSPDRRVTRLAGSSVEVTGTVPSVVEHLAAAQVVVVPLRMGGGTRLKIYEGMAMGKAIVSTSLGAEGLSVHPGEDILLADDPKLFADDIVTLLGDETKRCAYGRAASRQAARFDWAIVVEQFEQVLTSLLGLRSSHDEAPGQLVVMAQPN